MKETTRRQSAVSTMVVMGWTLVSRLLGFLRTAMIGALFGAGGTADVLVAVFNIPNNFRKLLAEGALSTAFIPELSREIAADPKGPASRRLAREILALQLLILLPLLLVAQIIPQHIVPLFIRFSDPVKEAQSIALFRWMSPYLLLVSVSAVMMAVLNSHNEFFVPAVTPVLFSLCVIASLALGARRWGGTAMAWGVLAGGAAQIAFQYPRYRRLGYRLEPLLRFDDPAFRKVMKRWVPVLLTSSLFTVNHQIAMLLASTLADKSTSALFYAIVFWQLPFGLFSVSITTVLFPKMSRQAARNDREGLADSVGFGYRNLAALLVPSAAILIVLGAPIVAVAFQRRAFTAGDTMLTARVLAAYAWGMPFVGLFNISQRALFALGELRRPFYAALITVITDIGLSIVFIFGFGGNVVSLAWANSLAFVVGAAVQYFFLRSRTPLRLRGVTIRTGWKVLLVTALAVVMMKGVLIWTGDSWWRHGSDWRAFGILAAIGLSTLALIVALYAWLKVEAVSIIIKRTSRGETG